MNNCGIHNFSEESSTLPEPASVLSALKSDDEDVETKDEQAVNKVNRSLTKKKKAKRLVLSDDEESDNEAKPDEEESDIESEQEPEKEVMYDSEENEIQEPQFKGFRGKSG